MSYNSFICTQLNDFKYCYINISKRILQPQQMEQVRLCKYNMNNIKREDFIDFKNCAKKQKKKTKKNKKMEESFGLSFLAYQPL